MRTLDRYIIRQFLVNYVVVVVVLFALFILVDTIVDLDEFAKAGQILAERRGGLPLLWSILAIADWYAPISLLAFAYFSGLFAVTAMGFTFAAIARSRELLAMVSSGISLYRVCAPVLVVGALLAALSLPVQELIIPNLQHKLSRQKSEVGRQERKQATIYYMPDDMGNLFSAASYDSDTGTLHEVTILRRDTSGRVVQRITASDATWDDQRLGWRLVNGASTRVNVGAAVASQAADPFQQDLTFFPTDLTPKRLMARQAALFPLLLSLSELREMADVAANYPEEAAQFKQIMNSRFSLLVLNVLIMVMGLPFFLNTNPDNLLVSAVKAGGLCLGAWGGGLMLMMTGIGLFNPVTAAWLPVVIYLPIAAGLLLAVKT